MFWILSFCPSTNLSALHSVHLFFNCVFTYIMTVWYRPVYRYKWCPTAWLGTTGTLSPLCFTLLLKLQSINLKVDNSSSSPKLLKATFAWALFCQPTTNKESLWFLVSRLLTLPLYVTALSAYVASPNDKMWRVHVIN